MVGLFSGSTCNSRETASRSGRGTRGSITSTCSFSCGNGKGNDEQGNKWLNILEKN